MADIEQKMAILADSAKFDASCASSGSSRPRQKGGLGNAANGGICHTWGADGRCVSLLKILQSNACIYDCAYCQNRRSNTIPRATLLPEELAQLTIQFYRRNYIEGLFLSSGIVKNPDYTMEMMIQTASLLRNEHRFGGYIHMKAIPGADARLIHQAGMLADRISCNIELPSSQSLGLLAPQKQPEAIFTPMRYIRQSTALALEESAKFRHAPSFAPAGQSTQMIIGATPDTDLSILRLSSGLYRKYRMRRVYYSAYIPMGNHPMLPNPNAAVPLLREHRLYQADWLLRFYGFSTDELLDEQSPHLDSEVDPKCQWALRHPEYFPVEVNRAHYETLLRVPGIGQISAKRIIDARRQGKLREEDLSKMGVVLKRALYFLTVNGKYFGRMEPDNPKLRWQLAQKPVTLQLSIFDPPTQLPQLGDGSALHGQL